MFAIGFGAVVRDNPRFCALEICYAAVKTAFGQNQTLRTAYDYGWTRQEWTAKRSKYLPPPRVVRHLLRGFKLFAKRSKSRLT